MAKHIFVTGGVASSLGKGLTASSLGRLLRVGASGHAPARPYITSIPKTMNPFNREGLRHRRRRRDDWTSVTPALRGRAAEPQSNATTGSIYQAVWPKAPRRAPKETAGDPAHHQRDQDRITSLAAEDVDVVITEVGGTVGDIESCRSSRRSGSSASGRRPGQRLHVHVTLVPFIGPSGEQKTKPTQHSVTEPRSGASSPTRSCAARTGRSPAQGEDQPACDVPEEGIVPRSTPRLLRDPARAPYEGTRRLRLSALRPTSTRRPHRMARAVDRVRRADSIASGSSASTPTCPTHGPWPRRCVTVATCGAGPDRLDRFGRHGRPARRRASAGPRRHRFRGFGFRRVRGQIAAAASRGCRRSVPRAPRLHCATIEFAAMHGLAGANSSEFDPHSPSGHRPDGRAARDRGQGGTMRLGVTANSCREPSCAPPRRGSRR